MPQYEQFEEMKKRIGNDGILVANICRSPLQEMLITYAGIEKTFFDLFDHPKEAEQLLAALADFNRRALQVALDSPAEVIISTITSTARLPIRTSSSDPFTDEKFDAFVARTLAEIAPGDGIVLGVGDNVMPDAKIDRVVRVARMVEECARYPIPSGGTLSRKPQSAD